MLHLRAWSAPIPNNNPKAASVKLYYHPFSPFARKPLIAAHLLGLKPDTQLVDLFKGEQRSPEFRALNPQGRVPTLVDGDFLLWESNAIVQYLGMQAGDTPLYPADARSRADILRWQFWESTSFAPACVIYVYENVLKAVLGRGAPDPVELAKAEEKFHICARLLDGHLATRPYLLGDALTLADVSVAPVLMHAEAGHYPLDGYPHIAAWFGKIRELPAWIATEPPRPK
jgi:glutathione S-transferase